MKRCAGHWSHRTIMSIQVALAGVCITLATLVIFAFATWNERPEAEKLKQLSQTMLRYQAPHEKIPDVWWLDHVGNDLTPAQSEQFQMRRHEIEEMLRTYKDLSSTTKTIAERFGTFRLAFTRQKNVFAAENTVMTSAPNVCFVPRDSIGSGVLQSHLQWDVSSDSVLIAAINVDKVLFAGTLFHEFLHALRYKERPREQKETEEEFAEEEVEAHELEALVLNAATKGAYLREIDRIAHKAPSYIDAITGVSAQDLQALDRAAGSEHTSPRITSSVLAEHLFLLGSRFIDLHDFPKRMKVKMYQWLTTHAPSYNFY